LPEDAAELPHVFAQQAWALWRGLRPVDAGDVGLRALDALPQGPERTRTAITVAISRYACGQPEAALGVVERELSRGQVTSALHALRANMLGQLGRFEDALIAETTALADLSPRAGERSIAAMHLALLAATQGRPDALANALETLQGTVPSLAAGPRLA